MPSDLTTIGFNAFLVFLSRKHHMYYNRFSNYGQQEDSIYENDADEETKEAASRGMDQSADNQPGTSTSSNY
ncbi:hypothetical protein GCK72_026155 [Caenorhabditis remanei]|uniref:Uncharacterized protein n=1 Tax=Caenorhabditis remanei TaxID=31234 RepID=A0A6A5G422_CAERE|nr:hypothetical protein GCK72_026155 [Caenorhabditis remanei]KAF1749687.1 hypothetical protein GCK72_026155 [Caenorhabditis remanei]